MAAGKSPSREWIGVLDVLEQLPATEAQEHFWAHLFEDVADRSLLQLRCVPYSADYGPAARHFRLLCHRSCDLADTMTRRLLLVLSRQETALETTALLQTCGNLLSRAQLLQELSLASCSWSGVGDPLPSSQLVDAVALGGVHHTLHVLELCHQTSCTASLGAAIGLRYPNLRKVSFSTVGLEGAFVEALQLLPSLAQVQLSTPGRGFGCGDALRHVATLRSLRTVTLTGVLPPGDDVAAALAQLHGLHELCMMNVEDLYPTQAEALLLGRALGCLTQLTRLVAPNVEDVTSISSEVFDTLVAQLGGLQCLASLSLPYRGFLLKEGFAALCQLSRLTYLLMPALSFQQYSVAGPSGFLPHLRHLGIDMPRRGEDLAATLRALRPLAQLRSAELSVTLDNDADPAEHPRAGAVAAADMWRAATFLAEAPLLESVDLTISCDDTCDIGLFPIRMSVVTGLLMPLRCHLTTLHLLDIRHQWSEALDVMWPILCEATHLDDLTVSGCSGEAGGVLAEGGLATLCRRLASLRRLSVRDCVGLGGAHAVAVAAARTQPLHVVWRPALDAAQRLLFGAAARYGVLLSKQPAY